MRQLHSNWVEYSLIPCLFHFLSSPVPVPSSERQWAKQRLKVRKKKQKTPILLHRSWIQPQLLWIHFPTTEALENSSGGMREEVWEKKCFVKCWQWRIFLFISPNFFSSAQLLVVLGFVQAPSEGIIPACSSGHSWQVPCLPQWVGTPAPIPPSIPEPPFSQPRPFLLLLPLTESG